jgi:hypothetical protein
VAFAAFFEPLFGFGERGSGATGSRVLGGFRLDGFAAQLLDALADRREIVGGAGSGHVASSNYPGAGAVWPGRLPGAADQMVLNGPETGKSSAPRTCEE